MFQLKLKCLDTKATREKLGLQKCKANSVYGFTAQQAFKSISENGVCPELIKPGQMNELIQLLTGVKNV